MAEINLLPVEERSAENFELLRKRILYGSIGFLIFCAVSALVVLGFFSVMAGSRSALIARVEDSSSTINSQKATEELIVVVKGKAQSADKILAARNDLVQTFNKLALLIPQGVYFSDLKIGGGKITVSGKARSSGDMAGLVSALVSSAGAEIVTSVNVDSLSSNEAGAYSFSLNMQPVNNK